MVYGRSMSVVDDAPAAVSTWAGFLRSQADILLVCDFIDRTHQGTKQTFYS